MTARDRMPAFQDVSARGPLRGKGPRHGHGVHGASVQSAEEVAKPAWRPGTVSCPEGPFEAAIVVSVSFLAVRNLELLDGMRRAMNRVPLLFLPERRADAQRVEGMRNRRREQRMQAWQACRQEQRALVHEPFFRRHAHEIATKVNLHKVDN